MKLIRMMSLLAAILAAPLVMRADEAAPHPAQPGPPAVEAPTEEKEWSVSLAFDLWSEYIFRGVRIADNDPMYNPAAVFAWKGLSVWYWGAFGESQGPDDTYEENDYGIDYTHAFMDDKLSITAGALMYHYPDGNSGRDTYEVYGKASYATLLNPAVSLFYDIDEFRGGYLTFSIGHSFDLGAMVDMQEPMAWSLDPSAALSIDLGYNDSVTESDVVLNDLLLGLKTTVQITEMVSVHACIQYSIALEALSDVGGVQSDNHLIGNVGVGLSF